MKTISKNYEEYYATGKQYFYPRSQLKVNFRGHFFRFEQLTDAIKEVPTVIDVVAEGEFDLKLHHHYNHEIKHDGYKLKVLSKDEVVIETGNMRGFQYGFESFMSLLKVTKLGIYLTKAEINHTPSFEMRGIIEGFYGIPWTSDDRLDLIDFLAANNMNTYMYAPKDDELQRKRWREFYPNEKLAEFETLLTKANDNQIDFYYMISPGNDINYLEESEVKVLTDKLQQMIDLGVNHFGLLLDDIDYILKGDIKNRFHSTAHAHAYLINQVNDYLASKLAAYELVICPTEYDNRFGSHYLEVLSQEVAPTIPFFWTGPDTLAGAITTEEIARMAKVYNRQMVIWDNVPVNDYQNDHELLFLTPYENRSKFLANEEFQVLGIVSNPMCQWQMSKVMVGTMAEFLWNAAGYEPARAVTNTLTELYDERVLSEMLTLATYFPNRYMRGFYSQELLDAIVAQEFETLDPQVSELAEVCQSLKVKLVDHKSYSELAPWLDRGIEDALVWEKIKHHPETLDVESYLKETKYRIGQDIPRQFVRLHLNK
ncbi:beta-N-acetylglucosaminidase domain-containing protein [Vagococcus zengguangii]|uniref:Hyaluronidase n=1 Tax=Vagococcus zengguangii TaxID=2571750 RepID=A0A4D7CQ31_9ENTE|nr:protein O-GlcNAcase [Vagococcus zengguangii]QCI86198.1 hyaluronidase [Vagococcus zengguangii]